MGGWEHIPFGNEGMLGDCLLQSCLGNVVLEGCHCFCLHLLGMSEMLCNTCR